MSEEETKDAEQQEDLKERNMIATCIDTFKLIFTKLGFSDCISASLYYVIYIAKSPTSQKNILEEAKSFYGKAISMNKLKTGEAELIKNKLFNPATSGRAKSYQPIDPILIWNQNKEELNKTYQKNRIKISENEIKQLHKIFKEKFKDIDNFATVRDCIKLFSPLFADMQFKNFTGASIYYTILIAKFATSFNKILNVAQDMSQDIYINDINSNMLSAGRKELLERGLIAQVVATRDESRSFGREAYLPIDPSLVWQENKNKLKDKPDNATLEKNNNLIETLNKIYTDTFGIKGIRTETGSVTIMYSKGWIMYFLKKIAESHKNLDLMLSSLDSLETYKDYYKYMLNNDLQIRVIFDEERGKTVKAATELKSNYSEKFKVKFTPVHHTTSRKIIYTNLAVDGRKILPITDKEPSYIGTIYLQSPVINYIKVSFEAAWTRADPTSPS